jgi:hypothetical protein
VNRIKRLFALGAGVAVLASQACNSSAPPRSQSGASRPAAGKAAAAAAAISLRIDLYPAALTNAQFTVEVSFRDSLGQLMNVSDQVTISLSTNPTKAILQGTTTRAAVSGVARFTDLVIGTVGTGYQLTASSSPTATAPATSAAFNVTWSEDYRPTAGTTPNNTPSAAQPISPNVPMFGPLGPGEVHYYKFHAKVRQLLSVSSYADRLDIGNWDTSLRLRLIAPDGITEIARGGAINADSQGADNGFLLLRIPSEGDYYLVCDVDRRGFLSGNYALVMTFPEPAVVLQDEIEPWGVTGQNDTPATAETLQPGLLYGHHDIPATNAPTSDYYKIAIPNPSRVRIELTAARNGAAYGDLPWNPRLELQDPNGAVLWANEDTYFRDPAIDYIVTTPGTYYVRVTRSPNLSNTGSGPYFLSYQSSQYSAVATAARNTTAAAAMPIPYGVDVSGSFGAAGDQYFAFGGTAGDVVRLVVEDRTQLQGASLTMDPTAGANAVLLGTDGVSEISSGAGFGSATESKLNIRQTILQATGTYFVRVRSAAMGSFGIRLERVAVSAREIEPNNTVAQANPIDASGWISGAIGVAGDIDHFLVHAEAGQLVTVSLLAARGGGMGPSLADWGSALMPNLEVRDVKGTLLSLTSADRKGEANFAESTQRPDPMVETSFRAPAAADYDIVVSDTDGQGGANYFYALHVWKNQ